VTGDDLDLCNGDTLDDCNPFTADGSDEPWYFTGCDGLDSDLCDEGIYGCSGGLQVCSDLTGDSLDWCNTLDDDCNPATPDGFDEPWMGDLCDGSDNDLCLEGTFDCVAGAQDCGDTTGDIDELCNGLDDDCDTQTDEDWPELGNPCTNGVGECESSGLMICDPMDETQTICDAVPGVPDPPEAGAMCFDTLDNDCDSDTDCSDPTDCSLELGCTNCGNGVVEPPFEDCDDGPLNGQDGGDGSCSLSCTLCQDGDGDGYYFTPGCNEPGDPLNLLLDCDDTDGNIHPGAQELCDGIDNDCDFMTSDGIDEPWYNTGCDGPDSDLCLEGAYSCVAGFQVCNDLGGDDLDLCDGDTLDDCNPATPDGFDEPWYNTGCDGPEILSYALTVHIHVLVDSRPVVICHLMIWICVIILMMTVIP